MVIHNLAGAVKVTLEFLVEGDSSLERAQEVATIFLI
jgi:hypothetical protein